MKIVKCVLLVLSLLLAGNGSAETVELPPPGPRDTCPVCGMFVAKYPSWVASVQYRDGHMHHFDGAKDLYKYLLDLPRWAPGHQAENIVTIGVTEYYSLALIDAQQAWYVIGSDVLGPMGHELIPLESEEDANAFMQDHKGVRILRHGEVTQEMLEGLDRARFE
ncbi:MAG: nitrous oxide reductase accessory protein NosL [Sedimenticola sp.]|nr:nitrous oxide reductase accessory protein NosL [Sedimenticola sp.]